MANVEGNDPRDVALQQYLRETAGRCPNIECHTTSHVDGELVEGRDELVRGTADVVIACCDGDLLPDPHLR